MKKIYLSILSLAIAVGANAQQTTGKKVYKHERGVSSVAHAVKPVANQEKATVLWGDTFDGTHVWTAINQNGQTVPADWVTTSVDADMPNAAPSLFPFNSSTSNGYALINSDGSAGNTDGDGAIVAQYRSEMIDLTASAAVVLRFNHNYRWWHEDRGVRVSGDGGFTWTEYPLTSDQGGIFTNGYPNNQNSLNPQSELINISAVAGGQDSVMLEFYYNDNDFWGWYWAVDDVEIIEQPADDIVLLSSYFSGSTNGGTEYGQTPLTQLDASYDIGAEVWNFGTSDAATVGLVADFTSFQGTGANALIVSGDTALVEELAATPALAVGVYNGTYTVVSAGELPGSAEFADNVMSRNFEVTNDIYALDGLDNNPAATEVLANIGTGSFLGGEDGLVVGAYYQIKAAADISGIRVMLNANTVAGGDISASLKDTSTWYLNDMSSLVSSALYTVTAADVSQGYADVVFDQVYNAAPNAYYACAELYSNGNTNDIIVIDDETVVQPNGASMIYIPGDQVYTNGTAIGVRMLMGDQWGAGVDENTLAGVSLFPNPSTGIVTISNNNNFAGEVAVYDMLGKVVATTTLNGVTTLDLTGNGTGVYIVKVSSDNGSFIERVVIK
ncbi:MAG: T9SS type A sorting domain-containing protein [Crocinitomicaceae bacterium]|nr:T9SS type A sorting domain-containing protein [Crocinitomicaceae bacterium]MDG1657956.1 T9SS type A sorting domain-containing protein [Crocinitomicaceae bacterium]